jgi:uncharacterized metal-binding protein
MADGETHDRWGVVMAVLLAVAVGISIARAPDDLTINLWGLPGGVLLGTLLLSPDLDMWNTKPTKRWGPLKFFWAPYAWAHKHRGLSHSWILGPAVRLLYLGAPWAIIYLYFWGFEGPGSWLTWLAVGVYLANWLHLAQDRHWPWS